ncbi:uncharacterized protein LOC101857586 [Aplysia californica]|uniref:Uncharacterized protein LOC101857586 n=1 Tax=Aplysia californica TaxID=6500 RepID=A0ABM0JZF4_APLCA|nr:uncharacterized protein LOC101857586 [Aplysia californica]
MLCADDEDASLKTPPVRPNDVIDIEVSPCGNFLPVVCSNSGSDQRKHCQGCLPGKTKKAKGKAKLPTCLSRAKKRQTDPMSRGDPFLPSVISDESPFADYPVKNSRKKPSDCKCKGSGYNLSPSALLPEEMRQQWGAGVFGKPTTPSGISRSAMSPGAQPVCSSIVPCNSAEVDNTSIVQQYASAGKCDPSPNPTPTPTPVLSPVAPAVRMSSDMANNKCQFCFQNNSLCTCFDFSHQGFRMPTKNDGRKVKIGLRTTLGKNKDIGISVPLSGKTASPAMKRIPCYSCKEHSNIISTSNFNKNGTSSSLALERSYISPSFDSGYFKAGFSCGRGPNRARNSFSGMSLSKAYTSSSGDFPGMTKATFTPKVRNRQLARPPHRMLSNISAPSLMPGEDLTSTPGMYKRSSKTLPRSGGSQMLVLGNSSHGCSCDTCRRVPSFMSRLDSSLDYPPSHSQQMVPPVLMSSSSSQKYKPAVASSSVSLSSQKRYHPYSTGPYAYSQSSSRSLYQSPDMHSCPSPPYEYESHRFPASQLSSSTPLSLAQDMSAFEASFSYLDNDVFSSPANSPGEVKDILDLSIKDTVEFFVSMKSPFVSSSPSPMPRSANESIPPMYSSSLTQEDESLSPGQPVGLSSCFCSFSNCPGSFQAPPPQPVEMSFTEQPQPPPPQPHRPSRRPHSYPMGRSRSHPSQSVSLLYSSLVSDLEDELRSAIENIPTD